MPQGNPLLGETWSDVSGSEAVVIALNDNALRLMARTGRRFLFPIQSFQHTWRLIGPAPIVERGCEQTSCRNAAHFRYHHGDSIRWTCEDHIPQGSPILFPGDPTTQAQPQVECPICSQTNVSTHETVTVNNVVTIRFQCNRCQVSWFTLLARGDSSDGQYIASTLIDLLKALGGSPVIRIGYVARRALERATGVSQSSHFQGVPVVEDNRFGPDTTIILTLPQNLQSLSRLSMPLSENATGADLDLVEAPENLVALTQNSPRGGIVINSIWRCRRYDNKLLLCAVLKTGEFVEYQIVHDPTNLRHQPQRLLKDQFLERWVPVSNPQNAMRSNLLGPERGTFWRSIQHRTLVQALGLIYGGGEVIHYTELNGRTYSVPLLTFLRLHKEIPYPPTRTLWVKDSIAYQALCGFQKDEVIDLLLEDPQGKSTEIPLYDLMRDYDPVNFLDESISVEGILSGSTWKSVEDDREVLVYDIAQAPSVLKEYIRYKNADDIRVASVDDFIRTYQYKAPVCPCAVGDEWRYLKTGDIARVLGINLRKGIASLVNPLSNEPKGSEVVTWVTFSDLTLKYQKVVRKSLFQHLDDEDP